MLNVITRYLVKVVFGGAVAFWIWIISKSQGYLDLANNWVFIVFFVAAFVIFFFSEKRFKVIRCIAKDLKSATADIEAAHEQTKQRLWDRYKTDDTFKQEVLKEHFDEYREEMKRLEQDASGVFQCDIENYINTDLIDTVINRDMLNLVPGVMTGFGILGTFIGLTFGLQQFNTGSAAEIAESIAPLMDGIKVAFYTSILGIMFSLAFNFVFKNNLKLAYDELEKFLTAFRRYVCPDSDNDSFGRLLMYQKKQTDTLEGLSGHLGDVISTQFGRMNDTIEKFAAAASERQVEGVGAIVDKFMQEMNQSLGDGFLALGKSIRDTCELQKQNRDYMQETLTGVRKMTSEIRQIHELSGKTIEKMAGYIEKVEKLQTAVTDNFQHVQGRIEGVALTIEKQNQYISTLVEYEKQLSEASEKMCSSFCEKMDQLQKLEDEIAGCAQEHMMAVIKSAQDSNAAVAETARKQIENILQVSENINTDLRGAAGELGEAFKQLDTQMTDSIRGTFDLFDKNLTEIARHLSGTISAVEATTERVPAVVSAAYEGMEHTFKDMQAQMNALVNAAVLQQEKPALEEEQSEKNLD